MLIGLATMIYIDRFIFKLMTVLMLTREFKNDHANLAFWTGKWIGSGMGWMAISQPARELCAKTIEMSEFAADFILGHVILFAQFPILCIPLADRWHSTLLFWLKPSNQIRPPIYSLKQSKLRKRMVRRYTTLYFMVLLLFVIIIAAPAVGGKFLPKDFGSSYDSGIMKGLFQPKKQNNNDTGKAAPHSFSTMTPSLSTWKTII